MSARTKTQRLLTLALALALLFCWVPVLGVPVSAANFMYEGVVFPDLPSTDLPYAYICDWRVNFGTGFYLVLCKEPAKYDPGIDRCIVEIPANVYTDIVYELYKLVDGAWELRNSIVGKNNSIETWKIASTSDPVIWSSHDILDTSGSLYFSGSAFSGYSRISSIDLSRTPSWVYAGTYIGVGIDVIGEGEFDEDCTCTVNGATSSGTYIELDSSYDTPNLFTLHVGADETATQLLLTVTSLHDTSVTASKYVSVEQLPEPTATTPDTPEGEEPMPTENNPTEPGETPDDSNTNSDNEKQEAEDTGNSSVDDLLEVIPDYSEGFVSALQNFTGAMSYTGTEAKLIVPAVMFPALGDAVPGFQMMDEMEVDFGVYVAMMPANLMLLAQSLLTIALIVYCFKELYGLISYFLTLKGGNA